MLNFWNKFANGLWRPSHKNEVFYRVVVGIIWLRLFLYPNLKFANLQSQALLFFFDINSNRIGMVNFKRRTILRETNEVSKSGDIFNSRQRIEQMSEQEIDVSISIDCLKFFTKAWDYIKVLLNRLFNISISTILLLVIA